MSTTVTPLATAVCMETFHQAVTSIVIASPTGIATTRVKNAVHSEHFRRFRETEEARHEVTGRPQQCGRKLSDVWRCSPVRWLESAAGITPRPRETEALCATARGPGDSSYAEVESPQ